MWDRSLLAITFQTCVRKCEVCLSSCFLELSLAVIFWEGRGQGNWVGCQMVLNRKGGSVCLQTRRGVVPLLPGALDKNQRGRFLPATAAPQRCVADESTPTREHVPDPKVLPRIAMSRSRHGRDSLPGTNKDGDAPYFKASVGLRQRAFSQPASLAAWFSPLAFLGDGVISAGREKSRVLGSGDLVSCCAHAAGFWCLGPALRSCVLPHHCYREQGCGGMSSPFSDDTKGAVFMSTAVVGPHQEGAPAVDADRDDTSIGSIPHPWHPPGHAAAEASAPFAYTLQL